jgi:hypothetical protein
MSVLRPLLSRRGRLVFVATALLLIGALVAAPSISGAKAAIKQFTAVITPNTVVDGVSGTWTERVKNCGTPVAAPCTASSTIAIGRVRITVPSEFTTTITTPASVIASNGSTWSLTYDPAAGTITAQPDNGSNKLDSGEFVDIPFSATPDITDTCSSSKITFTTTAIGGLPSGPDNQTFSIVGSQPSLAVGCTDRYGHGRLHGACQHHLRRRCGGLRWPGVRGPGGPVAGVPPTDLVHRHACGRLPRRRSQALDHRIPTIDRPGRAECRLVVVLDLLRRAAGRSHPVREQGNGQWFGCRADRRQCP